MVNESKIDNLIEMVKLVLEKTNTDKIEEKINILIRKSENLEEKLVILSKDNETLKSKNINLEKRISSLEYTIDNLEQKNLQNDVVISIPKKDLNDQAPELGKILSIYNSVSVINKLNKDNISNFKTLKGNSQNSIKCIPTFNNYNIKQSSFKDKKVLKSKNIYLSENLTKFRQMIYFECRSLIKAKKIKYCWTFNGNIFVKVDDSSNRVLINSLDDLTKF